MEYLRLIYCNTMSYTDTKEELFDEQANNGLIMCNKYFIPRELILKILCYYADGETLLNCQQVCKFLNTLMLDYVWRKKAEIKIGINKFLTNDTQLFCYNWKDYYLIYAKLFTKNLLKNSCGDEGMEHWKIPKYKRYCDWLIRSQTVHVPSLSNIKHCFVASFTKCIKYQEIDLIKEGFSAIILDFMQPSIEISEWYCHQGRFPAYEISVYLETKSGKAIDCFNLRDVLRGKQELNMWRNIKHEFNNYGKGLRKISFYHSGYPGVEMTAAYVKINAPTHNKNLKQK